MTLKFVRWLVLFKHDNSPVDGGVFIHKHAAEQFLKSHKRPSKLIVKRAQMEVSRE